VFNWFRRQFQKREPAPEATEAQSQTSPPAQAEAAETETAASESAPASSASSQDYLAWAKAAYQNIQSAQAAAAASETAESGETAAAAETSDDTDAAGADAGTTATEAPAGDGQAAADAASGPAWLQQSDGLERLRATAMEAPPVEGSTETAAPSAADREAGGVAFDDEFIWAAQVLADRGRAPDQISAEEIDWLKKLRRGLGKTQRGFVNQLKAIVGQGPLNREAIDEIEALLLQADVGIEATDAIIETLQEQVRQASLPPEQALETLKQILCEVLDRPLNEQPRSTLVPDSSGLDIWLIAGVNGSGKTTTIGKLAHMARQSGYRCTIAAADTFRAAAVEQVRAWGERSGAHVVANPSQNADPGAVVFDAISATQSRQSDLLLVDTAGRLQNKKNLMDELGKIRGVIDKQAPEANVESLLVIDATLGQNGLRQAEVFAEVARLSGVALTKLDGSAKGGVALAIAQQLNLPIRFVGAGEGIEDLRPFSSYEFVEALLSD